MPPHPHRVPLRTFQRPGFHLSSENVALDALRSARPPPEQGARQRNGGSTVKYSNATEKEGDRRLPGPASRCSAASLSLRVHDHRSRCS